MYKSTTLDVEGLDFALYFGEDKIHAKICLSCKVQKTNKIKMSKIQDYLENAQAQAPLP